MYAPSPDSVFRFGWELFFKKFPYIRCTLVAIAAFILGGVIF